MMNQWVWMTLCSLLVLAFVAGGCSPWWTEEDVVDPGADGPIDGREDGCIESGDPGWEADFASLECQVFELVNRHRSAGADCGAEGFFDPVPPLAMHEALREAARWHSLDMAERAYFSHESPGGPYGDDLRARVENAGYLDWIAIGENIGAGRSSAEQTVADWMTSPGHCRNIMDPEFTEMGVGYVQLEKSEYVHYWTQDFGRR